jgi:hypothetical protein
LCFSLVELGENLVDKGGGRELHGGFMVADFVYNGSPRDREVRGCWFFGGDSLPVQAGWLTIKEHDV